MQQRPRVSCASSLMNANPCRHYLEELKPRLTDEALIVYANRLLEALNSRTCETRNQGGYARRC